MGTLLHSRIKEVLFGMAPRKISTKNFKTQPAVGKNMASVFLGLRRDNHIDFLLPRAIINSE
jgi:hypothetical protein